MGSRRNSELGDRCGFCLTCGWGRRFMAGNQAGMPERCPDCGGEVVTECRSCGAPIVSLMGISCRECGEPLREATLFGVEIRRKPEKMSDAALAVDAKGDVRDNVNTSR